MSEILPKHKYSQEEFLKDASRIVAFYLPQYHEVAQNSEWWGKGFTDWVNVSKARPLFPGHYQPHIPEELGFYDASEERTLRRQSELAKEYGIHGFAFYWYWFDGVRILEKPIESFYNSDIDFSYCFCWANEPWSRTWDNNPREMLINQQYSDGFEIRLLHDLVKFWRDKRYVTVENRPLLIIYRVNHIPSPKNAISNLRKQSMSLYGINPYIVGVDFYDLPDEQDLGLDAIVEFPPHKFWGVNNLRDTPEDLDANFVGTLIDYKKVILQSVDRHVDSTRTIFRSCFPSWDNTARLGNRAVIIENTDVKIFELWLSALRQYTRDRNSDSKNLIFINAWNEWAEGAHLEPDRKLGRSFLEAVKRSEYYLESSDYLEISALKTKLSISDYIQNSNLYFDSAHYTATTTRYSRVASIIFNISPYIFRFLRYVYRKFRVYRSR
jgi:lipopolysaccharide biosynthesis protein